MEGDNLCRMKMYDRNPKEPGIVETSCVECGGYAGTCPGLRVCILQG